MKICATMSLPKPFQLLHKIPFCHTIEPPRVVRNPWRLSSLLTTQCSEQHTMLPPNADSAWPAARPAARPPAWAPASDLVDVEWANMHCAREITLPSARLDRNKGWRCIVEGQGRPAKNTLLLAPIRWSAHRETPVATPEECGSVLASGIIQNSAVNHEDMCHYVSAKSFPTSAQDPFAIV